MYDALLECPCTESRLENFEVNPLAARGHGIIFSLKIIALTAFLAIAGMTSTRAAVLNYDESISGDIAFGQSLPLGFGKNTILGTINGSGTSLNGGNGDFDEFKSILPANAFLNGIRFQYTQNPAGNGSSPTIFNYVLNGTYRSVTSHSGLPLAVIIGVPVTSLDYVGFNNFPGRMAVDYKIEVTLSPTATPLPGAAWLFLSGFGGFGGLGIALRRRTQRLAAG